MNITNAVAGNPRFQHLKTVLCTNMFNGSGNFTEGEVINHARKITVFFVAKHYVME